MAFTFPGHFPVCYGTGFGTEVISGAIVGSGAGTLYPVSMTLRRAWEWCWVVKQWSYALSCAFSDTLEGTCGNPSPPPTDLAYVRTRTGNATLAGTFDLAANPLAITPTEQRHIGCCGGEVGSSCHAMSDVDGAPGGTGWVIDYDVAACGTDSSGSYASGAATFALFSSDREYAFREGVVWPDRAADVVWPALQVGVTVASASVPMFFSSLQSADWVAAGSITVDGLSVSIYAPFAGHTLSGSITRAASWS